MLAFGILTYFTSAKKLNDMNCLAICLQHKCILKIDIVDVLGNKLIEGLWRSEIGNTGLTLTSFSQLPD